MVHNRVIISGTLGDSEVWSTSLRFMGSAVAPLTINDSQAELNDWAAGIETGLIGVLDILRNCLSLSGSITGIQTQYLDVDGHLVLQSPVEVANIPGLGSIQAPFSNAVVITQQTSEPGATKRGRNYWPLLAPGMTTDGYLDTPTLPADILTDWKSLVQHIVANSQVGGIRPCVYSQKLKVVTPVTSYRCGSVPDTQRRRRDALTETYSVLAV